MAYKENTTETSFLCDNGRSMYKPCITKRFLGVFFVHVSAAYAARG